MSNVYLLLLIAVFRFYLYRCDELKPCVECKVHNKGKYKDDCDIKCTQYTINIVDSIDDEEVDDSKICRYIEENCKLLFTYIYENDKIIASTLKDLQCSEPINLAGKNLIDVWIIPYS